MKRILTNLILLLLLISGCQKSELIELNLEGTVKGTVQSLDEFGDLINDNENFIIQLQGSNPLISVKSDSEGSYEIKNIPSGTYNLIITKDGYSEYKQQNFKIVGGDEPLYLNSYITKSSSTTIQNLSLEIVNDSEVYVKGIVNHNYTLDGWYYRYPSILFYIYNEDNPSDINYLDVQSIYFREESGSQLYKKLYLNTDLFPSGSQIYVIAYGYNYSSIYYYDITSNKYRRNGKGAESNIASITIP